MGAFLSILLPLAILLALTVRGARGVSTLLFAFALVHLSETLVLQAWSMIDETGALKAAWTPGLFVEVPAGYETDFEDSFYIPGFGQFIAELFLPVAAVSWIQERLRPGFLHRTKLVLFWTGVASSSYMLFKDVTYHLGMWILLLSWKDVPVSSAGYLLLNDAIGTRLDDVGAIHSVITSLVLTLILVLSLLGLFARAFRKLAART